MPMDIRLAIRIQGDHYRWQITPEGAPIMNAIIGEELLVEGQLTTLWTKSLVHSIKNY